MKNLHISLIKCGTMWVHVPQKNDSWSWNHTLTTSLPYLNHCGHINVLTSECCSLTDISHPATPFSHSFPFLLVLIWFVSVWELRLCHATVPPHSSLTSSCPSHNRERKRGEQSQGLKLAAVTNGETSREGGPVRSLFLCDAMEMPVASAGPCVIIFSEKPKYMWHDQCSYTD